MPKENRTAFISFQSIFLFLVKRKTEQQKNQAKHIKREKHFNLELNFNQVIHMHNYQR